MNTVGTMSTEENNDHRIIDLSDDTEVLSNNVVDKDVQSMFLPFTLLQTIVFSPKCRIKNNVITANNLLNKAFLLCGTVICVFLYFYPLIDFEYRRSRSKSNFQIFYFHYDCYYYSSGFLINFVFNLIQTNSYVLFVLTIQEVHRFSNSEVNSKFVGGSWVRITMIICFYFIFILWNSVIFIIIDVGQIEAWISMVSRATFIIFDAHIITAIRFIKLLKNKVVIWSNQVLSSFNDNQDEMCRKRLFQTYLQILKSYQIYKNISQQMYIRIVILTALIVIMWVFKNLTLQIELCLNCEEFYTAVEDSQDTCAYILTSNYPEAHKKLCKNVRRVHRASFSKMRACRLFYVDVCLLLHLGALIANYTVVLLQFAFL